MKRLYLVLMTVMFVLCAIAQNQRTVTGTVVYEGDNEPLIGATVMPDQEPRVSSPIWKASLHSVFPVR